MPSDPTRPVGPRYTPVQRRLLTAVAGLIVAALAGGAFALTYDVLRELAVAGGIGDRWAPLYPAMADTLTAMTILSLVVTRNARWWTRALRWALLLLLVAGGAALSVQHSVWGFASMPEDAVRAGVAIGPHVMLVIAVWLWLTMFKQIRVARPAAEEAVPADMQRGHVKVLEPAAPEQPAVLAPTDGAPTEGAPTGEAHAEEEAPTAAGPVSDSPLAFLDDPEPEQEPLIPFQEPAPRPDEPTHHAEERRPDAEETARQAHVEPQAHAEPQGPAEFEPAADDPGAPQPADHEKYEGLSSEPAPPLDALPEPRPVPEPAPEPVPEPRPSPPALLPTDVELVRGRDRDDADDERPVASTTRPDIVMPALLGADEEEHDTPPSDRAEDPDAGDHDRPLGGDARAGRQDDETAEDWNPPPSSSFRSGPTPPVD